MLKEYVAAGDVVEVERGLRALAAPFFHHEVVKQAILIATEDMKHAKVPCSPPASRTRCTRSPSRTPAVARPPPHRACCLCFVFTTASTLTRPAVPDLCNMSSRQRAMPGSPVCVPAAADAVADTRTAFSVWRPAACRHRANAELRCRYAACPMPVSGSLTSVLSVLSSVLNTRA